MRKHYENINNNKNRKRVNNMKEYTVIIPEMEFTIKAEDENEAEIQAIGLFDWGNVDMEIEEIQKESETK